MKSIVRIKTLFMALLIICICSLLFYISAFWMRYPYEIVQEKTKNYSPALTAKRFLYQTEVGAKENGLLLFYENDNGLVSAAYLEKTWISYKFIRSMGEVSLPVNAAKKPLAMANKLTDDCYIVWGCDYYINLDEVWIGNDQADFFILAEENALIYYKIIYNSQIPQDDSSLEVSYSYKSE